MFGIIGFLTQTFLVGKVTKTLGMKNTFTVGLLFTALSFFIMFWSHSIFVFIIASIILGVFNSLAQTLIPTILSNEADAKSQGTIMGLNASYQSLGMIFGPIVGGVVATMLVPLPFLVGGVLVVVCFFLSTQAMRPGIKKESAF
jgi:DHA1 family multidrug resistance protein-like MFS transporter